MNKMLQIAWREFYVTVVSKAFIIGLLLFPAIGIVFAILVPRLFDFQSVEVSGDVAVVDLDGRVFDTLADELAPEATQARRDEVTSRALEQIPAAARAVVNEEQLRDALPPATIRLIERPADADIEDEKAWLYAPGPQVRRLGVIVVHEDAVEPVAGSTTYGHYDLYIPPNLDDRVETEIRDALGRAIIRERVLARGLDPEAIRAMTTLPRVRATTVTEDEERGAVRGFNILLPAAFALLLMIGVMAGGQALLTSTVEEKSSRVIEVLLSAVSPMQLMAGKLLGQLAVSAVALSLYVGLGVALLAGFAMVGLLDLTLLLYLALFFVLTYLVMGSLMMAIGSAVNDMREAQTLMTPIMMFMILPWLLWMPISRDPDSTFSVVLSFLPPVNGFAMMLRLASLSPPPAWQVWLSILVGIGAVFGALWFAAKVFRIGLLMYGKPPNFRTLIRWARAA